MVPCVLLRAAVFSLAAPVADGFITPPRGRRAADGAIESVRSVYLVSLPLAAPLAGGFITPPRGCRAAAGAIKSLRSIPLVSLLGGLLGGLITPSRGRLAAAGFIKSLRSSSRGFLLLCGFFSLLAPLP